MAVGLAELGTPAATDTSAAIAAMNTTRRFIAPPLFRRSRTDVHSPRHPEIPHRPSGCLGSGTLGVMNEDAAPPSYPLEPSAAEMRSMGEAALELLIRFIGDLPTSPAVDLDGAEDVVAALRTAPREDGRPLPEILEAVQRGAAKAFNTTGPGYLAFIPGGGLYAAAVADFLACGFNRFVNVWHAAPGFAQIEWTVIRWLDDLFGLPAGSGGVLTSGGSMANFSAIATARRALLGEEFLDGTLYFSTQTHASVSKAAILAGFPQRNLRVVPTTPDLAVDVEALREMVQKDRADGL